MFAATSATNAHALAMVVKPGDLIILNGPRVAGMAPLLRDTGALVLWRLRVGADPRNDAARQAWAFLLPYLDDAHAFQFTDWDVVPPELADRRVSVIQPAIDISMEKNVPMGPPQVASVLRAAGIIDGQSDAVPILTPHDGRVRAVTCRARMIQDEPIQFTDPLVVQIARWDALKDPVGVIQAFAAHIAPAVPDARLVLAGPSPDLRERRPRGLRGPRRCHGSPCGLRRAGAPAHPPGQPPGGRADGKRGDGQRGSATPPWWSRRAWPRASGWRRPRRCGSAARWWPAAWAGCGA